MVSRVYYLPMDELEISGKRYISTRRAAREHGYHSDYMGQLIRGGKVAGQKVGRSWYIDEQSLAVYLGKEAPPRPAPVPEVVAPAPAMVAEAVPVLAVVEVEAEEVSAPEPAEPVAEVAIEKEVAPVETVTPIVEEIKEEVPVVVALPIAAEPVAQEKHEPLQEGSLVYIEEESAPREEEATRIPIHTAPAVRLQQGGLRYADDEASLPIATPVTRRMQAVEHSESVAHKSKFPIISLSLVGVLAIAVAAFASNFITATVVSEPGKSAVVQYAIHW
jgi:hypothetical protein